MACRADLAPAIAAVVASAIRHLFDARAPRPPRWPDDTVTLRAASWHVAYDMAAVSIIAASGAMIALRVENEFDDAATFRPAA